MSDPNRLMKWVGVITLVVIALLVLYPPHEKLKGGIDLVGGSSLLYEIDTTGLSRDRQRGLSTRVIEILRERVDPKGQMNLEWRPIGNRRIEIRMPRPPKEAGERRQAYEAALDRIKEKNFTRWDVERALQAAGDERTTLSAALVGGVSERAPLMAVLTEAHDQKMTARQGEDPAAIEAAGAGYEDAMAKLLRTNLPIRRFKDILALDAGAKRDQELARLRSEFPSFDSGGAGLLTAAVAAYEPWAKHKADLEDPSDLKRRLRGAGVLEYRILADRDPSNPANIRDPKPEPISGYAEQLARYGPRPRAGDRFEWFPIDNVVSFMNLDSLDEFVARKDTAQAIVEEYAGRYYALMHAGAEYGLLQRQGKRSWSLRGAMASQDPMSGRNIVLFELDPRGGQMFGELTGNNLKRSLCIMLDDTAMSHAVIQSRITTRGQIEGDFTIEKVQDLVRSLEAGSLPARLKETPLRENTIGPTLGETNRRKGLAAAVWGVVVVAIFVLIYYRFAGVMADLALALNLLFVLAVMALLQATFTLPGIAGLILTVGMAVDANVLIFERFREERDRGVIFKKALNAGYDKAFSTIMDANLTTLITCVILGFVGSEEVKGFAITLGIGISTSMFTALFVTRLVFNTLIAKGWLKDLSMGRLIRQPSIDWLSLRRMFWPVSTAAVAAGVVLFAALSIERTEQMYDIEFLGGTSLQIDLKPGITMTDEEVHDAISGERADAVSAVSWLQAAADHLEAAEAEGTEVLGRYTIMTQTPGALTGSQLGDLMRQTIEDKMERGGIGVSEGDKNVALFDSKPGMLTPEGFRDSIRNAARHVRGASVRLAGARVQSVGALEPAENVGQSYEIVTTETDRALVEAAVVAALGKEKLAVQQPVEFTFVRNEKLNEDPYFVVETGDRYLYDVIGGDANYDVLRFRGGVAVEVVLSDSEEPIRKTEFERRLKEVGLQPEFEEFQTRSSTVLPLGPEAVGAGGQPGHRRFAVLAVDDSILYDDDASHERWIETVAGPHLAQVDAALAQEKSLSKVIQFQPQIAGQTQNKAMFAIILALAAIVSYLWLRFGTKEYGLAAIVALVHDVAITLGLVGLCQFVAKSVAGDALLLEAFRVDLPMIAAVLTVIGYSLNDTIVVFDRIRENKGRVESLNPRVINTSINQTLSRTLLTSLTTFLVVFVLYVFGGKGVHGFSFALLIGVIVGTYSSVGIATPLLYRQKLLHAVVIVIVALGLVGIVFALVHDQTWRLIWAGLAVVACGGVLIRTQREPAYAPSGRAVGA